MNTIVERKSPVTKLLGQYQETMEGRDMEEVLRDPIVTLNTSLCHHLISTRHKQAKMGLISMVTSERYARELKLNTLWLVIYLFTLKDMGVHIVVQDCPTNWDEVPTAKKFLELNINSKTSFWSMNAKKVKRSYRSYNYPLVRIIPYRDGLFVELRKITSGGVLAAESIRSTLKDSWKLSSKIMTRVVDKDEIRGKLVSSGFYVDK